MRLAKKSFSLLQLQGELRNHSSQANAIKKNKNEIKSVLLANVAHSSSA